MNRCQSKRKYLVALLCGELEEKQQRRVEKHLKKCSTCRAELESLRQTMARTEELCHELDGVLASIDWDKNAAKIVTTVWEKETGSRPYPEPRRFTFSHYQLRPALAGVLFGILLGAAAVWFAFRGPWPGREPAELFFASGEFLDRVDLEIARRETLDYLEKSQLVLLDFVQMKAENGKARLSEAALQQAQLLLSKKKFLNPQLEKVQMAKAKEICDQIELLFYELASLNEGLSEAARQELQNLIESKSLLLKIRLLKKELQKSEV